MIIGTFTEENGAYNGRINAFALNVDTFRILPAKTKQGSGPDFIAYCFTKQGEEVEAGAAWRKTSKAGKAYLSVKLDSPALAEPIHCALTRQPNGGFSLIWTRREKEEATNEAAAM